MPSYDPLPSYMEFTTHVENLLFKGVSVSSVGGLLGLCFGVATFSVLYESIVASRHHLAQLQKKGKMASARSRLETTQGDDDHIHLIYTRLDQQQWSKLKFHLLQSVLHILQVAIGFFVMLIIMRYNGWLAISVLVASGVAHYCLGLLLLRKPLVISIDAPSPH